MNLVVVVTYRSFSTATTVIYQLHETACQQIPFDLPLKYIFQLWNNLKWNFQDTKIQDTYLSVSGIPPFGPALAGKELELQTGTTPTIPDSMEFDTLYVRSITVVVVVRTGSHVHSTSSTDLKEYLTYKLTTIIDLRETRSGLHQVRSQFLFEITREILIDGINDCFKIAILK